MAEYNDDDLDVVDAVEERIWKCGGTENSTWMAHKLTRGVGQSI